MSQAFEQALSQAERDMRHWPASARLGLRALKRAGEASDGRELSALAGLGFALDRELQARFMRAGHEISEAIFALHGWFSATPLTTRESTFEILEPYRPWVMELAEGPQAALWRGAWMGWLEVHAERMTMHRYTDQRHRFDQARKLFIAPLKAWVASREGELPEHDKIVPVAVFAEMLLAFADLYEAKAGTERGWNRIDVPERAERMGGFYGLGDEARPATTEALTRAASDLLIDFESFDLHNLALCPEALRQVIAGAIPEIRIALKRFIATGRWQPWWRRWMG